MIALAVLAVVTAFATVGGLSQAAATGAPVEERSSDEVSLDAAKAWDGYRIYYVGESYQGVPLTDVLKYRRYGRWQWAFIYGTCEAEGDPGICFPPLQVVNSSICNDFPARYYVVPRTFPFRGARAARNYAGGTFDVYTGRTSATTVTDTGRDQGVAAKELRPVAASAPSRLRPQAKGSLGGKLRCQRRWRSDVNGPHKKELFRQTADQG